MPRSIFLNQNSAYPFAIRKPCVLLKWNEKKKGENNPGNGHTAATPQPHKRIRHTRVLHSTPSLHSFSSAYPLPCPFTGSFSSVISLSDTWCTFIFEFYRLFRYMIVFVWHFSTWRSIFFMFLYCNKTKKTTSEVSAKIPQMIYWTILTNGTKRIRTKSGELLLLTDDPSTILMMLSLLWIDEAKAIKTCIWVSVWCPRLSFMVQKDTKVRTTLDADTGGKSVSEKSKSTVGKSKSEYFVVLGYSEGQSDWKKQWLTVRFTWYFLVR